MSVLGVAEVMAAHSAWALSGGKVGAAKLLDALAADGDAGVVAGMLLTRSGARSIPLLVQAIDEGIAVAQALEVLASIGSSGTSLPRDLQPKIAQLAKSSDPEVAQAAADVLQLADFRSDGVSF